MEHCRWPTGFRKVQRVQDHSRTAAMEPGEWEWLEESRRQRKARATWYVGVSHFLGWHGQDLASRKRTTSNPVIAL